jgi:UDP-N-acetylmuramate dehydrogenase
MINSPLNIGEHIPLAPLTTLKIGGEALFFARVESKEQLAEAFEFARRESLPVLVLGGGSNMLIADKGFDGLVLQIALKGTKFDEDLVRAEGGEDWDEFVGACVERNLAGVECLSGIPGLVGATPIQNVGAYGQDVSETIVSVDVFDREKLEFKRMSDADCEFSYRSSIFNSRAKDRYIVTSVVYQLRAGGEPNLSYGDLKKYFANKADAPSLQDVRGAVMEIRARKSMVISPDDPNSRSAGSFFKNPIVSVEGFDKIKAVAESMGVHAVPNFPAGEAQVKVPAAWLIEQSGFKKGYVFGNVGLSQNHTLAIINRGGAKAADVIALMEKIQAAVKEKFGVGLTPEPVFVGF